MVKRRTRSRRRRGGGFMSPQQAKEAGMTVTMLEDISTLCAVLKRRRWGW